MKLTLIIGQLIISVLLGIVILLQQRGSGLGDAFGGSGGGVYRSKRGIERTLHQATIVLAILFVASAIAALFVR